MFNFIIFFLSLYHFAPSSVWMSFMNDPLFGKWFVVVVAMSLSRCAQQI